VYPFATLPENLAAFCGLLRREHSFRVGAGELRDAARALEVIDISEERAVRHALRPILSSSVDDLTVFDRAFTEFFFPGREGVAQPEQLSQRRRDVRTIDADGRVAPDRRQSDTAADGSVDAEGGGHPGQPADTGDEDADTARSVARSAYSPIGVHDQRDSPRLRRDDGAWTQAARSFVRRIHLGLSRRWKPARRGRRFDLRRTLRASLQTGGEPLVPRWLRRPKRTPRFVLIVDGSRSMSAYTQTALDLAVALARATPRLEVFVFSTTLRPVTPEVRLASAGAGRMLAGLSTAWGGGTSIGVSLRELVERFGRRLLGRHTVVIIVSDGLDVGRTETLRDAMREIHRRSAAIAWLNPLVATPGYEPTAGAMRAARPFITTFAAVMSAADLAALAHRVRVRV